jgi:DNA-binding transcriptional regulator YdaS (Cro superfamily)
MTNLLKAIKIVGTKAELARLCHVTPQAVHSWTRIGPSRMACQLIEAATGGKVKAADLWAEKREAA